jgi:hypothetical protein
MHIKDLSATTTSGSKPWNVIDNKTLDQLAELERRELEQSRSKSKASKSVVQMSVRMEEEEYLRFRALCKSERRTNGEMLEHLMKAFLGED